MASKYPWVPKDYYPAVMFACKLIRETRWFNKSIAKAARHYDVDSERLEKYVRERQAAGQQGKKRGKMSWFVAIEMFGCDAQGFRQVDAKVLRGKSVDTVSERLDKEDTSYNRMNDYGGSYAPAKWHNVYGPYETKDEAIAACELAKQANDEQC